MALTTVFNQSYLITVAAVNVTAFTAPATVLAGILQQVYDRSNIAGLFEVKRLGNITIFTFQRNVSEDSEVIGNLTEDQVINQLQEEFSQSLETGSNDKFRPASDQLVSGLIAALNTDAVCVEGLPAQYPWLEVKVRLAYRSAEHRHDAHANLEEAVAHLANHMDGVVVGTMFVELGPN